MRAYLLHGVAALYGVAFLYIGILHFVNPTIFVPIVPPYFPYPVFWVYLTGVMEIAIGGAVLYPKTRVYGGRFFAAVFTAYLSCQFSHVAQRCPVSRLSHDPA